MENTKFYDIMNSAENMNDDELKDVVDSLKVMFENRRSKKIKEAKQRIIDAIKAYQSDFPDYPFFVENSDEYDIDIRSLNIDGMVL